MSQFQAPTSSSLRDYTFTDSDGRPWLLGAGTYGTVYRAIYRSEAERAVKFFTPGRSDLAAMQRELQKFRALREHPDIVTVYDFDLACDRPFYVMSLHADCEVGKDGAQRWRGRSLEDRIGKTALGEALPLLRRIAATLAYLHRHEIIHCDVKPANVLLTDEGGVKVCDFGQSRLSGGGEAPAALGTALYASPEQLRGRERAYGWDVYSFGVLAWRLITGEYPRQIPEQALACNADDPEQTLGDNGITAAAAADFIERCPAPAWPRQAGWLPPEERRIIERCLSLKASSTAGRQDTAVRYSSMAQVADAFLDLDQLRARSSARKRKLWAATALLTLVLAAWLLHTSWRVQQEKELAAKKAEQEKKQAIQQGAEDLSKKDQIITRQQASQVLNEGRLWLAEAEKIDRRGPRCEALLLAGRAIGYANYGRLPHESVKIDKQYPLLLGAPLSQFPDLESERLSLLDKADDFVSHIRESPMRIWSSPITRHHEGDVMLIQYSSDGRALISTGDCYNGYELKLWNPQSGDELGNSVVMSGLPTVSPDGRRVAAPVFNNIYIYDFSGVVAAQIVTGQASPVVNVLYAPDGRHLVARTDDGTLLQCSVPEDKHAANGLNSRNHEPQTANLVQIGTNVADIFMSPDNRTFFCTSDDARLLLYKYAAGEYKMQSLETAGSAIKVAAYTGDRQNFVAGTDDGRLLLYNAETGKLVKVAPSGGEEVKNIQLSIDGRTVVAGAGDKWSDTGIVSLWDSETLNLNQKLQKQDLLTRKFLLSPDGRTLIVGGSNGLSAWDIRTGTPTGDPSGFQTDQPSVPSEFSPDGNYLVSFSDDDCILWDYRSKKEIRCFVGAKTASFNSDGSLLAFDSDGIIKFWNLTDSKFIKEDGSGHSATVSSVTFTPDGLKIISASNDCTVRIWSVPSGDQLATLRHAAPVSCVAISQDGTMLASGCSDGTISLWNMKEYKNLFSWKAHAEKVNDICINQKGDLIASASNDGTIDLSRPVFLENRMIDKLTIKANGESVSSLALFGDGSKLVSASADKKIRVWSVPDGDLLQTISGEELGPVFKCQLSSDETELAIVHEPEHATPPGSELAYIDLTDSTIRSDALKADCISPFPKGGRHLFYARRSALRSGIEILSNGLDGHIEGFTWFCDFGAGDVESLSVSPDGTRLAVGMTDHTVRTWDVAVDVRKPLGVHATGVDAVAINSRGNIGASRSKDGTIRVWNIFTCHEVLAIEDGAPGSGEMQLSEDGHFLAFSPKDKPSEAWDLWTGEKQSGESAVSLLSDIIKKKSDKSASVESSNNPFGIPPPPPFAPLVGIARSAKGEVAIRAFQMPDDSFEDGDRAITIEYKYHNDIDLFSVLRQGLVNVDRVGGGKELINSGTSNHLFSSRNFRPVHHRTDEIAELALPDISAVQRDILKMQIHLKGRAWQSALVWMAQEPQTLDNPVVRQLYLQLLTTTLMREFVSERLYDEVPKQVKTEVFESTLLSWPLADLTLATCSKSIFSSESYLFDWVDALTASAPPWWKDLLVRRLQHFVADEKNAEEGRANVALLLKHLGK